MGKSNRLDPFDRPLWVVVNNVLPRDGNKTVFPTYSQILKQMVIPIKTSFVFLLNTRSKPVEQLLCFQRDLICFV